MNNSMSIEKTIGPRLVYKSTVKTKCIFLYLALWMIGVAVITALGGWASKNFYLSILPMIYWTIVIIPIIITEAIVEIENQIVALDNQYLKPFLAFSISLNKGYIKVNAIQATYKPTLIIYGAIP